MIEGSYSSLIENMKMLSVVIRNLGIVIIVIVVMLSVWLSWLLWFIVEMMLISSVSGEESSVVKFVSISELGSCCVMMLCIGMLVMSDWLGLLMMMLLSYLM